MSKAIWCNDDDSIFSLLALDRYEEPLNAACSEQIQFSTKDLLLERTLERKHDAKMQKIKVNNCPFESRIHTYLILLYVVFYI